MSKKRFLRYLPLVLLMLFVAGVAHAQPTEFTYQGRLLNGDLPANGSHDFEFLLWDGPAGGGQLGPTVTLTEINVDNGVFSVRLDFGNVFPGSNRFLEIRVRQSGGTAFTTLSPRQAITSTPYSIKSLNAENATSAVTAVNAQQLGGIASNQFVVTTDTRLTDERSPLPNSPNYIQNTTVQQAVGNFNIGGNGTVGGILSGNIVNSATYFSIGNNRVFSIAGTLNVFAGRNAGINSTGAFNAFFGASTGEATTGNSNSFFGSRAGQFNQTGGGNSFFGVQAGQSNVSGGANSFFGALAGNSNTGNSNSFFGAQTGENVTGTSNSSLFGARANAANNLTNATAIGFSAYVGQSNSLVLGSINGVNGATVDTFVGIGTAAPIAKLEVRNGEIASTGTTGGRFAASNPNNQNARVLLDWFNDGTNDFPRIRYGGSGAGASSGFLIQGTGNVTKLAVLQSGFVGIGTISPSAKLTVSGSGSFFNSAATRFDLFNTTAGSGFSQHVTDAGLWQLATTGGATRLVVDSNGRIGIGTTSPNSALHVVGSLNITNQITLGNLDSSSSTHLCYSASKTIASCSSSIRYKTDVEPFRSGLNLISRLRPVSFTWKSTSAPDFGLIAEEVAAVEPLLTFNNDKGEVEGVKYDALGVVLVNAVREQQAQIETQRKQIDEQKQENQSLQRQFGEQAELVRRQQELLKRQQAEIEGLKKLLCSQNPSAELCRPRD